MAGEKKCGMKVREPEESKRSIFVLIFSVPHISNICY
jgi:hypothetical protein